MTKTHEKVRMLAGSRKPNAKAVTKAVADGSYKIHCTFTLSPSVKAALTAWCSSEGVKDTKTGEIKPLKESAVIEELLRQTIPAKYWGV